MCALGKVHLDHQVLIVLKVGLMNNIHYSATFCSIIEGIVNRFLNWFDLGR